MNVFGMIKDFLGGDGGLVKGVVDTVKSYWPPDIAPAARAELEGKILALGREHEIKLLELGQKAQEGFDSRVRDLEGTAKDLTAAGIFGKIILFLRGSQRPVWGFFVLYLDFMVFSGRWQLQEAPAAVGNLNVSSAFWIINCLVLGFLFGERAVQNIMPHLAPVLNKGKDKADK